MQNEHLPNHVKNFGALPDDALLTLADAGLLACRSRASLYRDGHAGRLILRKIGSSTRIRVGDLRRLIGVAA